MPGVVAVDGRPTLYVAPGDLADPACAEELTQLLARPGPGTAPPRAYPAVLLRTGPPTGADAPLPDRHHRGPVRGGPARARARAARRGCGLPARATPSSTRDGTVRYRTYDPGYGDHGEEQSVLLDSLRTGSGDSLAVQLTGVALLALAEAVVVQAYVGRGVAPGTCCCTRLIGLGLGLAAGGWWRLGAGGRPSRGRCAGPRWASWSASCPDLLFVPGRLPHAGLDGRLRRAHHHPPRARAAAGGAGVFLLGSTAWFAGSALRRRLGARLLGVATVAVLGRRAGPAQPDPHQARAVLDDSTAPARPALLSRTRAHAVAANGSWSRNGRQRPADPVQPGRDVRLQRLPRRRPCRRRRAAAPRPGRTAGSRR